jgi:Hemerythrin HHE cation binding domain
MSATKIDFDPTDPKYQLKEEFQPDKEPSWPYPAEKDGWMHAHNAIRDEMRNLVTSLEATDARKGTLRDWEAKCIKKAWAAHEIHVHSHHTNEDNILVPFLLTRFKYPEKVGVARRLWIQNQFVHVAPLLLTGISFHSY